MQTRHYFIGQAGNKKVFFERNLPTNFDDLGENNEPINILGEHESKNVYGFCTVHVDDILMAGSDKFLTWLTGKIEQRFWTKTFEENDANYLGMHIVRREDGTIVVDSKNYEEQIQEIEISPTRMKEHNSLLTEDEEAKFRASLGKLMWVARLTRPDIAFEAAACAQKYEDNMELIQDYHEYHLADPFIKESENEIKDDPPNQKFESSEMDHMSGFEETSPKERSNAVNKINLNKKKSTVIPETHLKIKNVLFLNKAIRKARARKSVKILFTDITNSDPQIGPVGINDIRINIHCDASLMNTESLRSQIGVVAMFMSKTEDTQIPHEEYRKPDRALAKKLIKNQPYVKACPIVWSSFKCQRVATSSYASELQAVFAAFDMACVLRTIGSELLHGHPCNKMQVDVRNDNLNIVNAIHGINAISQEKRLMATLMSLREMLMRNEVSTLKFIPGTVNLADVLTKGTTGNDIVWLLTKNECIQVSHEEQKKKHDRTATGKQYLMLKPPK